jgi:ABC-type glycerol-3-phosphate transport system permease component
MFKVERPPWMERPSLLTQIGKGLVLAAIGFLMIFPFIYVLAVSFSSATDAARGGLIIFPRNPSLEAYRVVFESGIVVRSLMVSVGVTLVGTFTNMVLTVLMAYGLSRPSVRGSRAILFLVLFTMLFWPGLIPSFLVVKSLGLLNTYGALILPGAIAAFNLIILRNFFMSLPSELMDSARIDGANDWQVLQHIVLPLSGAVLAVVALFYGVGHWNEFFSAVLYLNDSSKWPVQLVLRQYVLMSTPIAETVVDPMRPPPPAQTIQMAVLVVATVPILIVYPFLQKYFTKGVLTGAIKG